MASIVLLAAGLAAGAVLAEAGLRIYAQTNLSFGRQIAGFDVLSIKVEPHGSIGYRPKPNTTFEYGGTIATNNAMGFRGPLVMIPKPPDTFRIVLLGGSTTYGWRVNDYETIDAYMREFLKQRYPRSRIEVVNLAFHGYDSYQVVERLRTDGLPLEPDLLIVNSGINDVRNAQFPDLQDPDPRTLLYAGALAEQREQQRLGRTNLFVQLKHVSYLARLPGYVRSLINTARYREERHRIPANPVAIEYFGRNMRRIAGLLWYRKVPILFSSAPSALALRFAPHDTSWVSYWLKDAETTEKYRLAIAARMRNVADDLAREGHPTRYLYHSLTAEMFLDDCHLTPEGNRQLAKNFADAAESFIQTFLKRNAEPGATRRAE